MSRKDTIHGAFHKDLGEEIERIKKYYEEEFGIGVNKLEASEIAAMRSQDVFWNKEKAKKALSRIRGLE